MSQTPAWIRRFMATSLGFPRWSAASPDRLVLVTNRSGSWQGWTHDLTDGSWRQVTYEPVGVETVHVLPDGRICWWRDDTGDERGSAMAVPFEDGGTPSPLVPDVPSGWPTGLSVAERRVALGVETDGVYRVHVADTGMPSRIVYEATTAAGVGRAYPEGSGGLSSDGRLACIRHTEHGDILHQALRVLDADSGATVGDLLDPGRNLDAAAWSPVLGDQRLLFTSELGPFERPAIWDLSSGERRDLRSDLPGGLFPMGWWPDGASVLVRHEHEGYAQLYRLDLRSGALDLIADPHGDIDDAAVRPDGEVWFRASDSVHGPRILRADGSEVLATQDEPPPGRPFRPYFFANPHGERIQSFVVTPDGDGPFPTVMAVHGGPEWHERDRFDPETQAFVDAGYAVIMINYRGSTGYGTPFRESLIGNVCFTETEDILACLDALEAEGVVAPGSVFWHGWSWGGCLGCFNAGTHPERWRAIFVGIPAGDFIAAHRAAAPELQAWDDAVYGGSPDEVPDAYRRSDPMTYVQNVRAPVLVIAGKNDPRCPPEGVTPWVEAVRARGVPVEVEFYPEGHHTNAVEGQVHHMQLILDFFERYR